MTHAPLPDSDVGQPDPTVSDPVAGDGGVATAAPPAVLVGPPGTVRTRLRARVLRSDRVAAPPAPPEGPVRPYSLETVLLVVAVLASCAGVAFRFLAQSSLWLDEALTVDISRLPVAQLLTALRHDGSPPAYYLLLHVWMKVFGTGDVAVRALPGLLSVATLGAAWALGRAVGGRRTAVAFSVLMATSPFAIRYGSENRMYALVALLATLGALAVVQALRNPTPRRLVAVGVLCGLLLLTHYWALYLVVVTGAVLLFASVRGTSRTSSRLTLAAMAAGSLMFLPWASSFLFQAAHTGTPWSTPSSPMLIVESLGEFAGWEHISGIALFVIYLILMVGLAGLVAVSTFPSARPVARFLGMRSQIPGERWVGPIWLIGLGTLIVAVVGGELAGAAFAYRYATVILPAAVLLVALGSTALGTTLGGRRLQAAMLAIAAVLGVPSGAATTMANRTEASLVASRIRALARPGDVVAYCPDQLGPAVSRVLPNRYLQVTYPRFDPPQLINWVDYAAVNAQAPSPGEAARELVNLAGPDHQVWLVWELGYRTLGHNCEELRDSLQAVRPNFSEPVRSHPDRYYEHESLDRFSPS